MAWRRWWRRIACRPAPTLVLDKPAFTATPGRPPRRLLERRLQGQRRRESCAKTRTCASTITVDGKERWRLVFVVRSQERRPTTGARLVGIPGARLIRIEPVIRRACRVTRMVRSPSSIRPRTITDAPQPSAPTISDAERSSRARRDSLPLQIGSVVEEEITTTDRAADHRRGAAARSSRIGAMGPTDSTRISLSAPSGSQGSPASTAGFPLRVHPTHEVSKGRESWTYVDRCDDAGRTYEPAMPTGPIGSIRRASRPVPIWSCDCARGFTRRSTKRIAAGCHPRFRPELPRARTLDSARAVIAWLHHQRQIQRHSDLVLTDSTLEPAAPADRRSNVGLRGDVEHLGLACRSHCLEIGIRAAVVLLAYGPPGRESRRRPTPGLTNSITRSFAPGSPRPTSWIDLDRRRDTDRSASLA